jgi:predicted transcriptional regulator
VTLTDQQTAALEALGDGAWHADEAIAAALSTSVSGATAVLNHLKDRALVYRRRRQDVGPDVYEWRARP